MDARRIFNELQEGRVFDWMQPQRVDSQYGIQTDFQAVQDEWVEPAPHARARSKSSSRSRALRVSDAARSNST